MFENLTPCRPDDQLLIKLGQSMLAGPDFGEHPTLPAGYTYLGQLIAHDLSYDKNVDVPVTPLLDLSGLEQQRTPALDLDSIYGGGPEKRSDLYDSLKIKFNIGTTLPVTGYGAKGGYQNDLPRTEQAPFKAVIADIRNDENLAIAQTQVAFMKFHNRVVDLLLSDFTSVGPDLFAAVQKKVIQHYQWIVLNDFLPKTIEEDILRDTIKQGCSYYKSATPAFIPIEFSLAAFRFGHSMLAESYEWNRAHQSSIRNDYNQGASLSDLFRFTMFSGTMTGAPNLPGEWIIDWTRFFDFTGINGVANNPKFNNARRIDTTLTPALGSFSEALSHFISNPDFCSIPVVDLVRGSRYGLPSGQEIARKALGVDPLSPREMIQGPGGQVVEFCNFSKETPLMYYILKEAEVYHRGERLGPVGSRIVAETIVGLLNQSPYSILQTKNWKPDLGQRERGLFEMVDLLAVANVVNPLGS